MSETRMKSRRIRQTLLVYVYTVIVVTSIALAGLFSIFSVPANLYGVAIYVLGIVVAVLLELFVIASYYMRRKFAQLDETLKDFRNEIMRSRSRLDEFAERSESRIGSLNMEVLNMRESIGRFSKLLPSNEPSIPEQYKLRNMIESVKKNANLFLLIVDTYDHLKMLKGGEFVELQELMEMIVRTRDVPRNKVGEVFDNFRRDFPEYVTMERDRRGTSFVRIRKE